ncbi:MAG: CHAD domain-containing protein [Alphaproteobacteria bacterium]|nr:CHAD domain-containing protein [Alphaproteobacteria bacterium]
MARERELKLEIEPAAAPRIAEWLRAKGGTRKSGRKLHTVYFDTNDLSLHHNGVSLRIRHSGDTFTQTIKRQDPGGVGLFDRPEWEKPVHGFIPDLAAARKTGLKPLKQPHLSRLLNAVFEVEVRRVAFELPGANQIALTIDRGRVIAGKRRARLCEIEIESLDGSLDDVFKTAKAIAAISPLRLSIQSKSARGYALLQENETGIFRAGHVALASAMPSEAAFRTIARDCLRQLIANLSASVKENAEALHQMRVGLRRLRASISAFSEMLQNDETEHITSDLRWVGQCLGAARDLDVLLDALQHQKSGVSFPPSIIRRFERHRHQAYVHLRQAVSSIRFRDLLLEILTWIECGDWRNSTVHSAARIREQPVIVHAARELRRGHKKLVKQLAGLAQFDPAERHRLRIRTKRLRYAVEFFGGLFPGRKNVHRRDRLLSALKDMQGALGDLNDLANRERLVSEIVRPSTRRSSGDEVNPDTAVALYRPDDGESAHLTGLATHAARRIERAKPFWQ